MPWKRMVMEIGMGTDIRGTEPTKAAVRALRDALWHNSLSIANAVGQDTDAMRVAVTIGVPEPEKVNTDEVLAVLPHGTGTCEVVEREFAFGHGTMTYHREPAHVQAPVPRSTSVWTASFRSFDVWRTKCAPCWSTR